MKQLLALLVAIPSLALAQDQPPRIISLDEAIAMAQQNSPQANSSRLSLKQAQNAVRASKLAFFGSVSVNASASERNGDWAYSNGISTGISNILNPATYIAIGTAKRSLEAAELSELTTTYSIKATVKSQFFAALFASEQLAASQAALTIARTQFNQTLTTLANGGGIPSDTLDAIINLYSAENSVSTSEFNLRTANLALTRTVGSDVDVQANPADTAGFKFVVIDSLALLGMLENGPGMQTAAAAVVSAKTTVTNAKLAYIPKLNWNINFSRSGSGAGFFGYDQDPFRYSTSKTWKSFSLSMTLWDNFNRENTLGRANVQLENQRISQKDTQRQLRQQLLTSINTLRTTEKQIALQILSIAAAETRLNAVSERYRIGLVKQLDVATAQEQLNSARRNLIQQRNSYRNAKASLEQLIGRDLD